MGQRDRKGLALKVEDGAMGQGYSSLQELGMALGWRPAQERDLSPTTTGKRILPWGRQKEHSPATLDSSLCDLRWTSDPQNCKTALTVISLPPSWSFVRTAAGNGHQLTCLPHLLCDTVVTGNQRDQATQALSCRAATWNPPRGWPACLQGGPMDSASHALGSCSVFEPRRGPAAPSAPVKSQPT